MESDSKESIFYILKKSLSALKNKGVLYVLFLTFNKGYKTLQSYFPVLKKDGTFSFENKRLRYCNSDKNQAWASERKVEVPIGVEFISRFKNKRILEIGNVMDQYWRDWRNFNIDVVDKYEISEGVMNEDIVDYVPKEAYDLVVSISTLEHVGWDETPRNPKKFLAAIKNIKNSCLKKGGVLMLTVPIDYNHAMDELIKNNIIRFDEERYFKRISLNNEWVETSKKDAFTKKYNYPYEYANAIMVGIVNK